MNKDNPYLKSDEESILEKGICENNIFIYFRDKYFYIQENHIRSFKFSLMRAKNTLDIKHTDYIFKIFIKYIRSIKLEKENENMFFLNISFPIGNFIFPHKIKLKEINNYLFILGTDNSNIIIKKQNDKIASLLSKINEYEKRFKDSSTDDEFILPIQ